MSELKPCPFCKDGGTPIFVYYEIPESCRYDDEPDILLKRIECAECGSTVSGLSLTVDHAIDWWNAEENGKRKVLKRWVDNG